jgi:hypothetical protein
VSDYAKWKKAYDEFDQERKGMGVLDHAVFQEADDPNDVTLWHEFSDAKSAHEFMESPRLREVMSNAGVAGEPQAWFTVPARTV